VADTGRGIAADQLPHIFERFYQVDDSTTRAGEGTGIGLALTLELVKLLRGSIQAESELGKGSTFSVSLPIRREAPLAESIPLPARTIPSAPAPWPHEEVSSAPAVETVAETERPTLLIVEDNVELAQYLQASLEADYHLSFALDGAEGIEKALAEVPSLIISDVMMPRKNGFELCAALKSDERTSHIPIVLLTAKVDAESRLQGLRRGADAYLGKPFNLTELRLQLRNLGQMQAKLRARYQSLMPPPPAEEPIFQLEDEFLAKARQTVLDHLDEPEFTVTAFCKALAVSRTQLHNKLKALTGHSATSFLRALRLQRAQTLLRTTALTVSEVAYEVGFNDPNYFSRCYRETYGLPPTEERGEDKALDGS
jgi:DNA-binding response OmpR family regulator